MKRSQGIQGLKIEVWQATEEGGKLLIPDEQGCFGELTPGSYRLAVIVTPEAEGRTVAFIIKGNNASSLNNKADAAFFQEGGQVFMRNITVRQDSGCGNPYPITFSQENNIRVGRLYGDGRFELYELALIGQQGKFFVWCEVYSSGRAYKDVHQVVCPAIMKWEGIHRLVAEQFIGKTKGLSLFSEWAEPVPDSVELGENQGKVLWFSGASGTGAAELANGVQARIYWREVAPREKDGLSYLIPGEIISFREKSQPDAGNKQTSFKFELKGIEVAA